VRGEAPTEIVEEWPQSHDVGMQHDASLREPIGTGVYRVDGLAVGTRQHDVLDIHFIRAGLEFGQLLLR